MQSIYDGTVEGGDRGSFGIYSGEENHRKNVIGDVDELKSNENAG